MIQKIDSKELFSIEGGRRRKISKVGKSCIAGMGYGAAKGAVGGALGGGLEGALIGANVGLISGAVECIAKVTH